VKDIFVNESLAPVVNVEFHEVYENQQFRPLEIQYYFIVPEGAVFTGLWLGEHKEFTFEVSTRGAAQAVYNAQKNIYREDPALLEQVGPNQYRLRAYPVPSQGLLHMYYAYQLLSGYPRLSWFPTVSEKRNVFWNWMSTVNFNHSETIRSNTVSTRLFCELTG
jgi:hypothetical protein